MFLFPWIKWHRFCFSSGRQVKPTSHMIRNTQGYAALFAVIQACCHDFQTWYYIWFTVVCGTVALMAQHCCVEFSVVYLIMLIKNNFLSISSGEMYSVWLSPQALEFQTPLFSSFGTSRDYGMDLCLEVYLWTIYPYFTTFRVTTLSFY